MEKKEKIKILRQYLKKFKKQNEYKSITLAVDNTDILLYSTVYIGSEVFIIKNGEKIIPPYLDEDDIDKIIIQIQEEMIKNV